MAGHVHMSQTARTEIKDMALLKPHSVSTSCAAPDDTSGAMEFVNYLRFAAMKCRTKPRTDLFKACALLKVDKAASAHAHADALMRCINEALGKPARLYAPGTAELTFDEHWLLQLGRSYMRGDEPSQRFLLASRVGLENRRFIRFLIGQITKDVSPI
jgi:hypothetical protein